MFSFSKSRAALSSSQQSSSKKRRLEFENNDNNKDQANFHNIDNDNDLDLTWFDDSESMLNIDNLVDRLKSINREDENAYSLLTINL